MEKNVITVSVVVLVILMLAHGLLKWMGISEVEPEYYYERVETSQVTTINLPTEYGMPEQAFVQLTCDKGPGYEKFQEVWVIKTDKGLFLENKTKNQTGEFFSDTPFVGAGFDKGKLLPANVSGTEETIDGDPANGGIWWSCDPKNPILYSNSVRFCMGCPAQLAGSVKGGVMQNYTVSIDGQVVRFEKTYDSILKHRLVRNWYWEDFKEDMSDLMREGKEYLAEVFTF